MQIISFETVVEGILKASLKLDNEIDTSTYKKDKVACIRHPKPGLGESRMALE